MAERLSGEELVALVKRVFVPRANEAGLAILVDLPDGQVPDLGKRNHKYSICGHAVRQCGSCTNSQKGAGDSSDGSQGGWS